jgi:glycosyltransferase involved in cell wall biosynthesis
LVKKGRESVEGAVLQPKENWRIARLYRLMLDVESSMLQELIEKRRDVAAWYCPTAFWPRFHEIGAPRLMCVPDVVIAEFPAGFASVGGDRYLESFREVERAIGAGAHFVTYSEDVKWRTLVRRYGIDPVTIRVVPHGANELLHLVQVSGTPDDEAATAALCRNLFTTAVAKAVDNSYATFFKRSSIRFIFYPSQFRPNKNLISLLRAYEYLLRRRFVGHKLVLTGNPSLSPEIGQFIAQHNLENDVLCLYDLSDQELAACYRLADLAVNPSLTEGGLPFTFSEALSLGTPVVMARMPATEEVVTDTVLRDLMLFDPFDWKDIAQHIEWALQHRDELLQVQVPVYEKLSKRTWRHVVDEHIDILAQISAVGSSSGGAPDQQPSDRPDASPNESDRLLSDRRASA